MGFVPRTARGKAVLAAASASAAAIATVPVIGLAHGDPQPGTVVSFGDSIPANPTILDVGVTRYNHQNPEKALAWPTIEGNRCAHGKGNVGQVVSQKTGLHLEDYSCAGAPAYTPLQNAHPMAFFPGQVDAALADGNLNADTRLVSIIIGVNDTYQRQNQSLTQEERIKRYTTVVGEQVERIKAAAPNATVVMVGYPDETDGQNRTCATAFLGVTSHWYFPYVPYFQDELRKEQRMVAEQHGTRFIDMVSEINVAQGNSGCTQDGARLNAALFDDDGTQNLGGHLTAAGVEYYAQRISDQLQ